MKLKTTGMRIAAGASTALLALTGLVACGGGSATTTAATTTAASEAAAEDAKEPYAYLGYGNIPDNDDLAIMATYQYYDEFTNYYTYTDPNGETQTRREEVKHALNLIDYASQYLDENGNVSSATYCIDGQGYSINYEDNFGFTYDAGLSGTPDEARANVKNMVDENDESESGYVFVGEGKGAIPLAEDTNEYDYYEYTSSYEFEDENGATQTINETHRVYVEGNKLVAMSYDSDGSLSVQYFHKVSAEIPDGFIALPDTTGIEMQ